MESFTLLIVLLRLVIIFSYRAFVILLLKLLTISFFLSLLLSLFFISKGLCSCLVSPSNLLVAVISSSVSGVPVMLSLCYSMTIFLFTYKFFGLLLCLIGFSFVFSVV